MATLDDLLTYGDSPDPTTGQPRANALQQATAVQNWIRTTDEWAQTAVPEADRRWLGRESLEGAAAPVLEELRTRAMAETVTGLFPDPEERASFLRVLDSSGGDWKQMDAPESWVERARLVDEVGKSGIFATPRTQRGSVGVGPNVLGRYTVREQEDGTFRALVMPTAEGASPVEVTLPPRAVMAAKARAAADVAGANLTASVDSIGAGSSYAEVGGGFGWGAGKQMEDMTARAMATEERAALLEKGPESMALHAALDMQLQDTPEFLATIPQNWLSQFTARPIAQGIRGLAQATAAIPGADKEALTAEGSSALELATPGALRNRYEANGSGGVPIADQISSGIESFATIAGPGLAARLAGRVAGTGVIAAERIGAVSEAAGWSGVYASAFGQNFAQTEQTAASLEVQDPDTAARLRRWNGLTSAAKAGIELATEKIFPGEADILRGTARHWTQIAMMPFQESVEEAVGTVAQNRINEFVGDPTRESPYQAAAGGLFGSVAFVGASAATAAMARPGPAATEDGAPDMGGAPVPPELGGDGTVPSDWQDRESLLATIAQRGGTVDAPIGLEPTAPAPEEPNAALFPEGEAAPSTPQELEDGSPNLLPDGVTPEEALAFQEAQDRHFATAEGATSPEPLRTLAAQLDLVREGAKPAMIFEGVTRDDLPRALRPLVGMGTIAGVEVPGGYVVYHKDAVKPILGLKPSATTDSVRTFVRSAFERPDGAGQLLGYGTAEKPADADRVVSVRDGDGVEVLAVAANAETEPAVRAATAAAATRVKRPRRDVSETFRNRPVAKLVMSMGGVMSKGTARKAGLLRTNASLWNDAPSRLADPTHNAVYGDQTPDQLAQAAHDAGLISDPSPTALWAAIADESQSAASEAAARRTEAAETERLEEMALNEEVDFTLAMRAQARADERRQATRRLMRPVSNATVLEDADAPQSEADVTTSAPQSEADVAAEEDDTLPFARRNPTTPVRRGISVQAAQQALRLLPPALGRNVRIVADQQAIAAEADNYAPGDWADMAYSRGFYDPRTGGTTVFAANVEQQPGETALHAAARVILHERVAHAGLAALRELDPKFDTRWRALVAALPTEELQATAARYPELAGNRSALAEEWLATQVELRTDRLLPADSAAGRLWQAVREALRRLFARFSGDVLDREVDAIIRTAVRALRQRHAQAQTQQQQAGQQGANAMQFARMISESEAIDPITIYRAGDASETGVKPFASFTEEYDTAESYTDNPGFGGSTIRELRVDAGNVLDLTNRKRAFYDLAKAIGEEDPAESAEAWWSNGWNYPWEESKKIRAALEESDYDSVRYADDFPEGATTIIFTREPRIIRPAEDSAPKFAKPNQRSDWRYAGRGAYRVQRPKLRTLLTGSALPREFVRLADLGQNEQKALDQRAAMIGQELQAAIKAHAKQHTLPEQAVLDLVDAAMQDPAVLQAMGPSPLREATRMARNYLDDLSEAIASITGGELGSAIMGNRGHWMRRSYAAFDPAAGWHYDALVDAAKAGKTIAGQPARKILRDAEAFLAAEDPQRTPAQIEAILRGLMERTNWETVLTGGGISKPVESLMRRKELPAELRAVMGEERNPLKRFTMSAGFQGKFVAYHEMQERMAQMGLQMGIFHTAREGAFTEPAGTDGSPTAAGQRRSGMAGLFTTKEMKAAMDAARGTTPDKLSYWFIDAFRFVSGEAKLNKVALNPDSWMVNILGNVIGLVQTGDAFSLRAYKNVARAIQLHRSGKGTGKALGTVQQAVLDARRAMLARLTAAGVADSSATLQDLLASQDLNTHIEQRIMKFIRINDRWDHVSGGVRGAILGQGFGRIFGTAGQAIGAAVGTVAGGVVGSTRIKNVNQQIANWVLGNPDRFGKITTFLGNYETHLKAGMPDRAAFQLAAEKTLDTMPDYSRMPELMREFSKLGIMGSFVAFQVEVYRNAFHNGRYALKELRSGNPALMARGMQRMLGLSSTLALAFGGLSAIVASVFGHGASDDEDKAYRRSLGRPWEKFGRLAYTAFDQEKASFFNTSYLVPQVTMGEILKAAWEGKDFGEGLANAAEAGKQQWAGGGVHTDPLLEALLNVRKDGQKVSYESGGTQLAERFLYYLRRALEPGAIDKLDRIVRAETGRDRGTRSFTLDEEMKRLLGVRQTTYKHADAIRSRLYEFKNAYADISAQARRDWKDNAPGARPAALTRANKRIAELAAEYQAFLQDMDTLRLTDQVPAVNDNRTADGKRQPILPARFRPLVETPDGPKHAD